MSDQQKNHPSVQSKSVGQRTLGESWVALPPKTRIGISLAVTGVALAGIYISDQLERVLSPPADKNPVAEGAVKDVPPP
ncbi:uncharacterized protein B0H18DRAFT_1120302 [Fomitopsis serialis]|uniref:uncharacterized protein n=1 Tax=Fomitopsis serialis TaxID=139415 RepID=UPI00200845B0|nr:uncharacterized protein B0H18DRAFT_1120302 [Neoantrodia serialis]KAH9923657.1 hypothetical protein B0H18DRAFT_1120302 [Neoantrodia serialis]